MASNELESILIEYEQKRRNAELDADLRKSKLYKSFPQIEQIDNNINKLTINKTKNILTNNIDQNISIEKRINELKLEKDRIVKNNNIDLSVINPVYECKICNDTGYILKENKKTQMCSCLKQRIFNISYNKSNLSNIKNDSFKNFNYNLFSDEVNLQKYKQKISPRKNIENIKKASLEFINNFDNPETKNLLFCGNTGLGKTYMSNAISIELLKKGKTVLYQTAPVLLETVIDNKFNKYKTANTNNFYNDVLEADLLIIDDLGTECLNSMKLSELFTILNTRILNLNNKVTKTIISTNLNIGQIFKTYEERIGSRIAGFYDIYYFFGEDLRLKKRKE